MTTQEIVAWLASPPNPTLRIPAGWYVAPPGGFQVPSGVRIEGEWPGRNRVTGGTIVMPATPNDNAFVLFAQEGDPAGNVCIENVIVRGHDIAGWGHGFVVDYGGPARPAHIEFIRCMAYGVGQDGFHIRHANASLDVVRLTGCSSTRNGGKGYFGERLAWGVLRDCQAAACADHGFHLKLSDLTVMEDCYSDGCATTQMVIEDTMGLQIRGGACERFYQGVGLEIRRGRECRVDAMAFLSGAPTSAPTGLGINCVQSDSPWLGRCLYRGCRQLYAGTSGTNVGGSDVSRY